MISCRKFIQLSISFRSFRVSIRAKEEEDGRGWEGHRLQLNHNDFVFNVHLFDAEACVCICSACVRLCVIDLEVCTGNRGEAGRRHNTVPSPETEQ